MIPPSCAGRIKPKQTSGKRENYPFQLVELQGRKVTHVSRLLFGCGVPRLQRGGNNILEVTGLPGLGLPTVEQPYNENI